LGAINEVASGKVLGARYSDAMMSMVDR